MEKYWNKQNSTHENDIVQSHDQEERKLIKKYSMRLMWQLLKENSTKDFNTRASQLGKMVPM